MGYASMYEDIQDRHYSSMADRRVIACIPRIDRDSDTRPHESAEIIKPRPHQIHHPALEYKVTRKKRPKAKRRTDVWRSPLIEYGGREVIDGNQRIVTEFRDLTPTNSLRDILREQQQHSNSEYERELQQLLNIFPASDVQRR